MKSPFPGMDPYLESRWSDVHATLIAVLKEALQPTLPPHLRARSEERVILETIKHEPLSSYRSDVAVIQSPRTSRSSASTMSRTIEPVFIDFYDAPEVDRFVQIIDTSNGNRLVTAIEVLSPWNKEPGRLNKSYRKKLDDYARGDVSVVEIDLLRGSRRMLPVTRDDLQPEHRTAYMACIRRAWQPKRWEVYPIDLREPLPRLPIPLRQTDREVHVELQPLIDRVYVAGGHDDIDYTLPADPPLDPDNAAWAKSLLP